MALALCQNHTSKWSLTLPLRRRRQSAPTLLLAPQCPSHTGYRPLRVPYAAHIARDSSRGSPNPDHATMLQRIRHRTLGRSIAYTRAPRAEFDSCPWACARCPRCPRLRSLHATILLWRDDSHSHAGNPPRMPHGSSIRIFSCSTSPMLAVIRIRRVCCPLAHCRPSLALPPSPEHFHVLTTRRSPHPLESRGFPHRFAMFTRTAPFPLPPTLYSCSFCSSQTWRLVLDRSIIRPQFSALCHYYSVYTFFVKWWHDGNISFPSGFLLGFWVVLEQHNF